MQMEYADKRFGRHTSNEIRAGPSATMQRRLVESNLASPKLDNNEQQIPDITDFMNDMFFGTINGGDYPKRAYNLNGGESTRGRGALHDHGNDDFDSSTRSVSSRQTQEWLEEAKRMVASSPNSRGADSPTRLVGSPRFAASQARFSASSIDRRDPLSRSARRNRALEGFSSEILSKTATHTRKRSETNLDPPPQQNGSPTSDAQNWVSSDPTPPSPTSNPGGPPLPPRQSTHRRTRFQTPAPQTIPSLPANISLSKRTFKSTPITSNSPSRIPDTQLLSPPKHLVESAHRRSVSSSTCSVADPAGIFLSPPRNLVESAHRRSVSSSTCRTDRILEKDNSSDDGGKLNGRDLINGFLKRQRVKIEKLLSGEINGRAKIVLSGPSNSTSSMVAATCYAWLSENKTRASKKENGFEFVVPVMNIRRGQMWKHSQAAWLFDHVGLDATSLLFANEVDLETLMMSMQLSMLVVGEDILKTNGEVGSSCTVLTDHYCEDAYDLLQTPILKKLLLAGILLDTKNLSTSPKLSMARDAEAVQLLSVSSAPNYRNTLYDQLVQDQRDNDFFEALCRTYGKPPSELKWDGRISEMKIPSDKFITQNESNDARTKKVSPISGKPTPSPIPTPVKTTAKPNEDPSRGKNRNFFAKLFGFGSK